MLKISWTFLDMWCSLKSSQNLTFFCRLLTCPTVPELPFWEGEHALHCLDLRYLYDLYRALGEISKQIKKVVHTSVSDYMVTPLAGRKMDMILFAGKRKRDYHPVSWQWQSFWNSQIRSWVGLCWTKIGWVRWSWIKLDQGEWSLSERWK